jgi:pyruvate dehydrogenase E2 component (dihydrolipoamide acetyltransferase)
MAEQVLMPRQGNTVESCIILEWRKHEGDTVSAGDVLCEVETDKATFEVEAPAAGTVLKTFFAEGDDVPVLTPIAVVGEPGESVDGLGPETGGEAEAGAPSPEPAAPEATPAPEASAAPQPAQTGEAAPQTQPAPAEPAPDGRVAISPRARNLAFAKGLDVSGLSGTGPGGRIVERDVQRALGSSEPLSPAAIDELRASGKRAPAVGTGIGGRVLAEDLRQAPTEEVPTAPAGAGVGGEFPGPSTQVPVKGVRKRIADRMHQSLASTAQLTLNASADATQLMAYRKRLKGAPGELELGTITINDLVLFAVAKTLSRYPALNAHYTGESITQFEHVHLGFAVDTDRGLMVPVIRNAQALTLKQISVEANRLAADCVRGNVNPDELQGGTFTVTNLGPFGIESFTPVLNTPQVAILGVCTVQPKPVRNRQSGEVEFRDHIGLSLTIDHQVVDGAPAARFMKDFSAMLARFDIALAG